MKKFFKFALCAVAVMALASCGGVDSDAKAYVEAAKEQNLEKMAEISKKYVDADEKTQEEFGKAVEKYMNEQDAPEATEEEAE